MRVFVSFTGSDRDIKNRIVKALREGMEDKDTEIWESDEGCASDYSEECIEAIKGSQVFIILVSAASMSPGSYCLNEVIEAREQEGRQNLNILMYGVDGSPMTNRFIFHLNHISESNRVSRLASDEAAGIEGLVRRVNRLLQLRRDGTPELYVPELDAVKPGAGGYFVEGSRNGVFGEIDAAFERSNVVFLRQITGFGRKSAARKYAEAYSASYQSVYYFPSFRGSIREFLLDGLKDKCGVDTDFAILDEETRILRKGALLSGFDENTLMIVPETSPDAKDTQTVFDVLSAMKCRIIFITQSIPRAVSDRFPCVSVGRMDNEYLYSLFYHYYERAGEEDKESLKAPLAEYFDSIGGHTKTVELTAEVLSDGFVFPDEVPEKLAQITSGGSDELTDVISEAISNLFGIKKFDETEQKMLWCASVLAYVPVDEKDFIETLKEAGCFDPKKLRSLIGIRWLDEDRAAGLISVNEFLAGVCMARIKPPAETVGVCCGRLSSRIANAALGLEMRTLKDLYGVCSRMLSGLGMPCAAKGAGVVSGISGESAPHSDDYEKLLEEIRKESGDSEYGEAAEEIVDTVAGELNVLITAFCMPAAAPGSDSERLARIIAEQMKEAFSELDPLIDLYGTGVLWVYGQIRSLCRRIAEDPSSALSAVMSFTEALLHSGRSFDENDEDVANSILTKLYFMMIPFASQSPYAGLRMCEERRKLADRFGGYSSENEIYLFSSIELSSRVDLGMLDEDTHECFCAVKDNLKEAEKESEPVLSDVTGDFSYNVGRYAVALANRGRDGEAEEALYTLFELDGTSANAVHNAVSSAQSVALTYIGGAKKKRAVKIIADALRFAAGALKKTGVKSEAAKEALDTVIFMKDMYAALTEPPKETKPEEEREYENYYKANPLKNDRRAFARFEMIAEKAERTDYSDLSGEDLCAKRLELEVRAKNGEKPEDLAPEAFALADEAGYRVLGYRHRYAQFLGAAAMIGGNVAEIQNGEGKTYTLPLVAFLYSLYGYQVHIVDKSAYLCRRNFGWMRGVYETLGCSVGLIEEENDKEIDEAAGCGILYTTLYSEMFIRLKADGNPLDARAAIRRDVLIADEADYLIDEASSTYSIVGTPEEFDTAGICRLAVKTVDACLKEKDYTVREHRVDLGEGVYKAAEKICGKSYIDFSPKEKNAFEQAVRSFIRVMYIYRKDKDYFLEKAGGTPSVRARREDLHTGNLVPINRYDEFFILIREGVGGEEASAVLETRRTHDQISVMSVVRSFKTVCGATATAASVADLFRQYYGMTVYRIPTAKPVRRTENPPRLYGNEGAKNAAVIGLAVEKAKTGQPVLLVCESTYDSVKFFKMLTSAGVKATLLNAKNSEDRPELLANAGRYGAVTVTTALANRGVDICLGGSPGEEAKKELVRQGADPGAIEAAIYGAPGADKGAGALREKYNFLASVWNMRLAKEREKLEALGGLCVIGTTCFSDLRAEQQLIGRCARQGSPGESYVFYSLEDGSLKQLIGDKAQAIRLYAYDDLFIELGVGVGGKLLDRTLTDARTKLQAADLGDADRSFDAVCLYPERERFHAPVRKACEDPVGVLRYVIDTAPVFSDGIKGVLKKNAAIKSKFIQQLEKLGYDLRFPVRETSERLAEYALSIFEENCNERRGSYSESGFIRSVALRAFAEAWERFIEDADIEFYAPSVRKDRDAYLAKFTEEYGERLYCEAADRLLCDLIGARPRPGTAPAPKRPAVRRAGVGPNDPCPCGSGLKYKNCCGKPKDGGASGKAD